MGRASGKNNNDNGSNPEKGKKFRLQSRSLFLTYPKCNLDKNIALSLLKDMRSWSYIGIGHELHQDGTDHLHALLQSSDKFETQNAKYFDLKYNGKIFHGNYQGAKDNDKVLDYIKKNGDFIEEGVFLSNGKSAAAKRAFKNKQMLERPINELVNEGIVSLTSVPLIEKAKKILKQVEASLIKNDSTNKVCYWVYGTPGIGKSVMAYDLMYPGEKRFDKLINKWWDSYNNEDIVIMDDLTKDQKGSLTYFLRRWADKRSFPGECKGGHTQNIDFSRLIVTSNFLPSEIFEDDQVTIEAVERRFKIVTIFKKSKDERILVEYPYKMQDYIEFKPIIPERKVRPKIEVVNQRMLETHQKYHKIDDFVTEKMAEEEDKKEEIEEELKIDY